MNWTILFDTLFTVGELVSAGFLVYGGWLCRFGSEAESPHERSKTSARVATHRDPATEEFAPSAALPLFATLLVASTIGFARFLS